MLKIIKFIILLFPICLFGQTVNFPISTSSSPGSPTSSVQYNSSGGFGGMSNVSSDGTNLMLTKTSTIPTVVNDECGLFYEQMGNENILSIKSVNETPVGVQNSPLDVLYGFHAANGISTSTFATGVSVQVSGTAASGSVPSAHAGAFGQARTIRYNSGTSANSWGGVCFAAAPFLIGNGTLGGFYVSIRAANNSSSAVSRCFIGMKVSTGAPTASSTTSTIVNFVGLAHEVNDANYSIVHNDDSGTATIIDLGSNFPTRPTANHWYQLELWGRNSTMYYAVTNLQTGTTASGTISSNLPSNSEGLCPMAFVNNATSGASQSVVYEKTYYEIR